MCKARREFKGRFGVLLTMERDKPKLFIRSFKEKTLSLSRRGPEIQMSALRDHAIFNVLFGTMSYLVHFLLSKKNKSIPVLLASFGSSRGDDRLSPQETDRSKL